MWQLVSIELYKIFKRPRSYIGPVAIAVWIFLIQLALYVDGETYISFITQQVEQNFLIEGNIINGNLVAYIILQSLIVQMPLLVTLVSGDLISGEAASGTMRLLVTKPLSRGKILLAKFIGSACYTLFMIAWLATLSLGFGMIIFKGGDLIVLSSDQIGILRQQDILWRFFAAFGIAFLSLTVVTTLSLMFSCFADNSLGPILTTMAIIILFTLIGTMEIALFDKIKPFLFTTHMIAWRNVFEKPLPVTEIRNSVLILLGHIAAFMGISWYYFRRKDILS